MWAFGCIFASVILKKSPIFSGRDTTDQLVKIAKIMGHAELFEYINEQKIEIPDLESLKATVGKHPKKAWEKMVDHKNEGFATPEAISLLSHLLVYNPTK